MVKEISIVNGDYVFDSSKSIYVARGLLIKDERVLSAARKVIDSKDYNPDSIEYWFTKALQNEEFLRTGQPIDVRSLSGIEALFNELELPINLPRGNKPLRSRLMTSEEYKSLSKWSRTNDPVMYETLEKIFSGEVVHNPETGTYQIANTDERESDFYDITEKNLNSFSPSGFEYNTREVVEV